jgi:hypothetical protein
MRSPRIQIGIKVVLPGASENDVETEFTHSFCGNGIFFILELKIEFFIFNFSVVSEPLSKIIYIVNR